MAHGTGMLLKASKNTASHAPRPRHDPGIIVAPERVSTSEEGAELVRDQPGLGALLLLLELVRRVKENLHVRKRLLQEDRGQLIERELEHGVKRTLRVSAMLVPWPPPVRPSFWGVLAGGRGEGKMMTLASSRTSSLTSTAPSFTTLRRRTHSPSLFTLSLLSWGLMTVPLAT